MTLSLRPSRLERVRNIRLAGSLHQITNSLAGLRLTPGSKGHSTITDHDHEDALTQNLILVAHFGDFWNCWI